MGRRAASAHLPMLAYATGESSQPQHFRQELLPLFAALSADEREAQFFTLTLTCKIHLKTSWIFLIENGRA